VLGTMLVVFPESPIVVPEQILLPLTVKLVPFTPERTLQLPMLCDKE